MRLKKTIVWTLAGVVALCLAGVAAAQDASTDREGEAILKILGQGDSAGGWCTWTCSNGQSGSGPAPDAETCRRMCELSCGESCSVNPN